jgi:bifunctional DNase/RNase
MSLVRLNIKGISYSQTQSGAYALILSEVDGKRKLPIVIGAFEAPSIAIALEKEIEPPRPLTHDLFKSFSDRFDIIVKQVIIHKLIDGVFYASLVCERNEVEEIIDARTSDAIALALRFAAPIFTYKTILEKAGIVLKNDSEKQENDLSSSNDPIFDDLKFEKEKVEPNKVESNKDSYDTKTIDQLHQLLTKAVADEDYEVAAKIRDEISKR